MVPAEHWSYIEDPLKVKKRMMEGPRESCLPVLSFISSTLNNWTVPKSPKSPKPDSSSNSRSRTSSPERVHGTVPPIQSPLTGKNQNQYQSQSQSSPVSTKKHTLAASPTSPTHPETQLKSSEEGFKNPSSSSPSLSPSLSLFSPAEVQVQAKSKAKASKAPATDPLPIQKQQQQQQQQQQQEFDKQERQKLIDAELERAGIMGSLVSVLETETETEGRKETALSEAALGSVGSVSGAHKGGIGTSSPEIDEIDKIDKLHDQIVKKRIKTQLPIQKRHGTMVQTTSGGGVKRGGNHKDKGGRKTTSSIQSRSSSARK